MTKLEQAARQALEALEVSTDWDMTATGKQLQSMRAITALREALENPDLCPHGVDDGACKQCYMEQTEQPASQEPEVWYCPDCGTLNETQAKCCPDWIRSRKVPKNFALTCKATFDRKVQSVSQEPVKYIYKESSPETGEFVFAAPQPELNLNCKSVQKRLATVWGYVKAEQAEQEPFDMNDHPPHRLCECRKCMEYFTPLPDCDAFAASGKPIAEQEPVAWNNTIDEVRFKEPVIQKPVAVVEITYGREPECYVTGNIDDFPEGVFKLYAAPVRTKDLTDDEIAEIVTELDSKLIMRDATELEIARAVIAADREKNK